MLERISDLPGDICGVRASGRVSGDDYERVLEPILRDATRAGRRLRFLYEVGPDFRGFTASGVWQDARLMGPSVRVLERCAVVTDVSWVRALSRAAAQVAPFPSRVFADRPSALAWLAAETASTSLPFRMVADRGVLVVEPQSALRAEDFDTLAAAVDPWVALHGELRGVVVHARRFPGWASVGALLRHASFVREHERAIRRVAVVTDDVLSSIAPAIMEHFVRPEIRRFPYDGLDRAVAWAAAGQEVTKPPEGSSRSDGLGVEERP